MARERLEDLGRILEIITKTLDRNIFNEYRMRPKDLPDWFEHVSEEERNNFLVSIAFGIQDMENDLLEIWKIAKGEDELNGKGKMP